MGSRFVLADTEQLHRTVSEMSQRIRQLEEALAILQSGVSTETHALLTENLLSIKYGLDSQPRQEPAIMETIDASGTLTIGDSGESRYFGASAGSEVGASTPPGHAYDDSTSTLFFLGGSCAPESETYRRAMDILFAALPPPESAWRLSETYLENAAFGSRPLGRTDIIEGTLMPVYAARDARSRAFAYPLQPSTDTRSEEGAISPDMFAVLYLVFAQGVLVDLTLPPCAPEGERFHHYACIALALRNLFDAPTTETVQALLMMAHYRSGVGQRYKQDSVWALMSLGYRDPARWNLDAKASDRRRRVFWETYISDLFFSQAFGRPPSIEQSYIDCRFPECGPDPEDQYWYFKYVFTEKIFASVVQLTQAARPPSYKVVLDIDRRI
ncbi:hypothetical protein HWV62_24900, partial [Athelia sp. TMB]